MCLGQTKTEQGGGYCICMCNVCIWLFGFVWVVCNCICTAFTQHRFARGGLKEGWGSKCNPCYPSPQRTACCVLPAAITWWQRCRSPNIYAPRNCRHTCGLSTNGSCDWCYINKKCSVQYWSKYFYGRHVCGIRYWCCWCQQNSEANRHRSIPEAIWKVDCKVAQCTSAIRAMDHAWNSSAEIESSKCSNIWPHQHKASGNIEHTSIPFPGRWGYNCQWRDLSTHNMCIWFKPLALHLVSGVCSITIMWGVGSNSAYYLQAPCVYWDKAGQGCSRASRAVPLGAWYWHRLLMQD